MIAGDVFLDRARLWLFDNWHEPIRALTPLPCLAFGWWLSSYTLTGVVWGSLICYGIFHLALIWLSLSSRSRTNQLLHDTLSTVAVLVDVLFSVLLLTQVATLKSGIYPLYVLLILRVLATSRRSSTAMITPLLLGPTYLFIRSLGNPYPIESAIEQLAQWGMLLSGLSFGVVAIVLSGSWQHTNLALRQELRIEHMNREARIAAQERTTDDLRARVREMHALEEGLRVITSTLSLDEVLNQIVDSTVQMLNPTRVYAVTLSLQNNGAFDHYSFTQEGGTNCPWITPLIQRALDQQVPLVISDTALNLDLAPIMPSNLRSALCVPLFVDGEHPHGALTVVSTMPAAFSSSDARHLTAFAIQAGIAIHNAELHSRLHRQQRLIEAVMRDINDGLVVIDADTRIVLANPIGQELLANNTLTLSVQEELFELVKRMHDEDTPMLTRELTLIDSEEHPELVYLAFASQVRQDDSDEPLTAIVLHDITAQKAEERHRAEFISMVSHELRNPLNSLNGFIKIVLQGRAGPLSPLQTEFLEIADGQIEQLKARIAELLEYNRLAAGRLTLTPQQNDISLLAVGIVTRLRLQVESSGLTLINQVSDTLPECAFDSERIGQVLANLIENAIKATPPGGRITLSSEQHETEIWIRVSDTGIGISESEQGKIFQRFYQVHSLLPSRDTHLGLGLAICQQIIEGHNGRIWVESKEGQGSCFTFTLPYHPTADEAPMPVEP